MAKSNYLNSRAMGSLVLASLAILSVVGFLFRESLTFREVPLSILLKAMEDRTALLALLTGRKRLLHWRLGELGVEEEIKAFYRPKIRNEIELDRYIHQIFYDNTGYIGESYFVDAQGKLQFKTPPDREFNQWFQLASKVGLVVGSKIEDDRLYVLGSKGAKVPYKEIAAAFPLETLRKMEQAYK
jgi:hypothetical protein